MEYVLCIPMAFNDSSTGSLSGHVVYICTCQEMQSTVAQVLGVGIEARHSYTGPEVSRLDGGCCWQVSLLQSCAS